MCYCVCGHAGRVGVTAGSDVIGSEGLGLGNPCAVRKGADVLLFDVEQDIPLNRLQLRHRRVGRIAQGGGLGLKTGKQTANPLAGACLHAVSSTSYALHRRM